MEQILIQVKSREKAKILLELLKALDFVELIESGVEEELEVNVTSSPEQEDFFSMAGLWAGRDITVESIREQAWPRQ